METYFLLKCHVTPKAARTALTGWAEDVLRLRIAAPPEKGLANKTLVRFLAELLDLPQSAVLLVGGLSSRDKVVRIENLSPEEAKRRLSRAINKPH